MKTDDRGDGCGMTDAMTRLTRIEWDDRRATLIAAHYEDEGGPSRVGESDGDR
jgi:hypothetical protein